MRKWCGSALAVCAAMLVVTMPAHAAIVAETPAREIALSPEGTTITLELRQPLRLTSSGAARQRYVLRIKGLAATGAPQTGYDVFLNIDPGESKDRRNPGYVGTLNFFGAPKPPAAGSPRVVSFDVRPVLEFIFARECPRALVVSIYPAEPSATGGTVVIGGMAIAAE